MRQSCCLSRMVSRASKHHSLSSRMTPKSASISSSFSSQLVLSTVGNTTQRKNFHSTCIQFSSTPSTSPVSSSHSNSSSIKSQTQKDETTSSTNSTHSQSSQNTSHNQTSSNNTRFFLPTLLVAAAAAYFWDEVSSTAFNITRSTRGLYILAKIAVDYKWTFYQIDRYEEKLRLKHKEIQRTESKSDRDEFAERILDIVDEDDVAKQMKSDCHQRNAERLLGLCRENKGLYIKIGQYIASLNHILPREYILTLRVLQDHAPTVGWDKMKAVIERQLNVQDLSEIYSEFNTTPIASASLAQVHQARLKENNELVAVKIQYPHLTASFEYDMFVHELTLVAAEKFFPSFKLAWMQDEIYNSLKKELDFKHEAQNAERCKSFFKHNKNIHVPDVIWKYTNTKVLTMEWIDGIKITDEDRLQSSGISTKQVTKLAVEAFCDQIFKHGFVHADPHPGNMFVRIHPEAQRRRNNQSIFSKFIDVVLSPVRILSSLVSSTPSDVQLVLLDHGLYREVSEPVRIAYAQLWESLILRDDQKVIESCKLLGADDKNWELLAISVLMRPYRTRAINITAATSLEEHKEMRKRLLKEFSIDAFFDLFEKLPREILLVLRNQNYLRALNRELGVPVNRLRLTANIAVEALDEHDKLMQQSTNNNILAGFSGYMKRVRHSLVFQTSLLYADFQAWLAAVAVSFYFWKLSLNDPEEAHDDASLAAMQALDPDAIQQQKKNNKTTSSTADKIKKQMQTFDPSADPSFGFQGKGAKHNIMSG